MGEDVDGAHEGPAPEEEELHDVAPDVGHDPPEARVRDGKEADGEERRVQGETGGFRHDQRGRVEDHPEGEAPREEEGAGERPARPPSEPRLRVRVDRGAGNGRGARGGGPRRGGAWRGEAASSYCSHRRPPPSRRATKAGAPTRLTALAWLARMERARGTRPMLPPGQEVVVRRCAGGGRARTTSRRRPPDRRQTTARSRGPSPISPQVVSGGDRRSDRRRRGGVAIVVTTTMKTAAA